MTTTERSSFAQSADWIPGPAQGHWTYDDYVVLPDDGQRYEIVNGVLVMAPSPNGAHQDAVLRLAHFLLIHVEFAHLGKVRMAPFDVVLSTKQVFQPDVLVVLNNHLHRLQEKMLVGAPDLAIEVASPGTSVMDRVTKSSIYAQPGVSEYWIVNVEWRTVEVFVLEHGEFRSSGIFRGKQFLPSRIVPDLPVAVERFFA
jgi:Uma2 family endonuclease